MRVEYYATVLLLSFFLLLAGCKAEQPRYVTLAEGGQWERVLEISGERFRSGHQVEDLYWIARAHHETAQHSLAQQAIDLYFALAYEGEITVPARRLAVVVSDGRYAIEQGRILEEMGMMDSSLAPSYYQALMQGGRQGEANRVFVRYLGETLEARAYAQLLIRSHADSAVIAPALAKLEAHEAIALLWEAAQMEHDRDGSGSLAALGAEYEKLILTGEDRLLLYGALSRLYAMADLRVLSNKYRSLSQGL